MQTIDVSQNYILSVDVLNQFRNVTIINASHNYIQDIALNLAKLQDLNLSNNFLTKFPLLHHLPKIKKLDLSSNKITEIKVDFKPPASTSLIHLDISNNPFEFATDIEM